MGRLHIVRPGHSFRFAMVHNAGSSAQRIRIGLTGLAFAFLLVLLGSVISRSGTQGTTNASQQAVENEPREPLAYAAREKGLPERSPNTRPTLLLLTSLPIVFGEDFALDSGGSPALAAL